MKLSLRGARALHLAAQGLASAPRGEASKEDVAATIRRMRLLQIDTIHVVARSPYLVLFARLGAYPMQWLEELLSEGVIFETWAHEACFAPMEDHALHRLHLEGTTHRWSMRSARRTHAEQGEALKTLLEFVREKGPVKATDFERAADQKAGWWSWKPEKRRLEALFALGELMITRRERFQRVYDLRERVLAKALVAAPEVLAPSADDVKRAFSLRAVEALGVTQARWVADYFRTGKRLKDDDLAPFVASGELERVEVHGFDAPFYVHERHRELARAAAEGDLRATHTTLLSPFDPVIWDRERASSLFDFEYRIECYTPAPKRQFGYFVLPLLRRGELIGRLDAKAHRKEGRFEVLSMHFEEQVKPSEAVARDVARALVATASWHGTPEVTLPSGRRGELVRKIRACLRDSRT